MNRKTFAESLGISRRRLNQLLSEGMPDNLPAAIRWRESRRRRIAPGATIRDDDPAREARTVDQIRTALTAATDYEAVKILSEKLKGLLTAERLIADVSELVRVDDAQLSYRCIQRVCELGIAELAAGAPHLAGLTAAEIQEKLMALGIEVLGMMADKDSRLWQAAAAEFPLADSRLE